MDLLKKEYTGITYISGPLLFVENAKDLAYGAIVDIKDGTGRVRGGQVIEVSEEYAVIQVFEETTGLDLATTSVSLVEDVARLGVSKEMLGRRFNGIGKPIDGLPPITPEKRLPITGLPLNPVARRKPEQFIQTGISAIDGLNTLVRGQKLPIFSGSGEPYNQLLSRIAMQAQVDVIVLGGMGLKYDDYLYFRDTLEKSGAMGRTVMFIHTASDPTVECTLVPDMALAVAEQFALAGKRVLVLLTDMTNYADAQKEMAITMEQVPSNRGYPGDLYSCLAARYEKAVDFEGAGSITILGVTTMPGDDVTHPVPDNTGYITEGQYYLKNGHIEPFGSLSRLKQNVNDKTRSDHRALMDGMIRLYSAYKESLEKKSMGFMMSEWDEKLLKYGHLFETKLMDLSVNIPLEEALDLGWEILAECFEPNETGLKTSLIQERWPKRSAVE